MQTGPSDTQLIATRGLDRELSELELIDIELRALAQRRQRVRSQAGGPGSDARVMRVPANYFTPSRFPDEPDWWAKQLGGR